MDNCNSNIPVRESAKNVPEKRKTLTPAILGMPYSHGVKFSVNMTSEDKKELLAKLEEWREARKQKLAASILAKQKQADKSKASVPSLRLKSKPIPQKEEIRSSKFQDRQSVFERLYQNNGKTKKQEVISNFNKEQQIPETNFKKSVAEPLEKLKNPEKDILVGKYEAETVQAISESGMDTKIRQEPCPLVEIPPRNSNAVHNTGKTKGQMARKCFVGMTKEKFNGGINLTKPTHLVTEQVKVVDGKSFKKGSALKSLPLKTANKDKTSLRRSISMMFHKKRKTGSTVYRSVSEKNLNEINFSQAPIVHHKGLQIPQQQDYDTEKKTKDVAVNKTVLFATPKNTKLLRSTNLRTKLEDWLKMNGHSLEGYRHLRCFGVHDGGKLFSETTPVALDDSQYATAPNTPEIDSDKENATPLTVIQQADLKDVENWLEELHRLIVHLKYPPERCEEWLAAIRKKCVGCSKLSIYWECLAALHESKGDLKSAIEDYERAIIKGSEVDTVGESLAQLFDKMVIEQKKSSKGKLDKGIDPKNIFKSTIIKFALQQKAIKRLGSEMEPGIRQQLYIATPVRRSTRIQTPFKSTDEILSLRTLTPEFRKNITFKPNESLLNGN